MKDLIAETKSSLEKKINDVEIDLNTRVITVQEQVSDLHTDVNNMKTSSGTFQYSTNEKFTDVWAKFKEIKKEIANLPRNYTRNCGSDTRSQVVVYSLILALLNFT